MSQQSRDPLIGTRLGDYVLQSLIGRGGMARVYRGLDEKLERPAAIKVLEVHADEVDDVMIKRFKLEARSIARFDHPNIVTIYQYGEEKNLFFIAMKLIEGESLTQVLRQANQQGKLLPPERIIQVMWDVCAALDYAHERGIIHRDVKPSNILFDTAGRAILTDFGLALEEGGGTTLGTAFGTPRYISPEQAVSSQKAVAQSDIYSLGVVAFEMVTGRVPFHDESPMSVALYHITNPPPRPRSLNPDVPVEVEVAILKALEKAPEDRYQTAGAFAEALEAAYSAAGYDVSGISAPHTFMTAPGPLALPVESGTNGASGNAPMPASHLGKDRRLWRGLRRTEPATAQVPVVQAPAANRPARRRLTLPILLALAALAVVVVAAVALARPANNEPATSLPALPSGGESILDASAGMTFILSYGEGGFALRNPGDRPLAVGGLVFERGEGDNRVRFAIDAFVKTIPPGQCAWIRPILDVEQRQPSNCPEPIFHITLLPRDAALFWEADGGDSFRVLAGEQTLQTCSFMATSCRVIVPSE